MLDDGALVCRCQRGEMAAFEALFARYSRKVLQTAYLITGDRAVAEEVMQDAFTQTFRVIAQLREPEAFRSWLYTTAVRQAQRTSTRERSEQKAAARVAALAPEPGPGSDLAERELVWEAISQLPEQQRAAIVLHYFHDEPVARVAQTLGAPEGTVKSWLHRAKAALARSLGGYFGNAGGEG